MNGDGTKLFVIGANGDDITQWTLPDPYDFVAMVNNGTFSVSAQEATPTSLDFRADGQRLAIVGTSSDSIHRYNLATGYDVTGTVTLIETVSLAAWSASPQSIRVSSDGMKAFVLDRLGQIYEFDLLSAWGFTGMTL